MPGSDKQLLRKAVRTQRLSLDPVARSDAAFALCANLVKSNWYRRCKRIAAYIAVQGEIDLAPFVTQAMKDGKTIFLPRLLPFHTRPLGFARYDPRQQLVLNRFGIPEPERHCRPCALRVQAVRAGPLRRVPGTTGRCGAP